MNSLTSKVEVLLAQEKWQEERKALRTIILESGLTEDVKWGNLCYTSEGKNILMIYGMKDDCALGFFKGALMEDPEGVLAKPGENSQAMRRIHFTSAKEIRAKENVLKAYIKAAIEVEKSGLKIDFSEKENLELPAELLDEFSKNPDLEKAFKALTPGRQRGYNLYFSGAKQSATRRSRIEKSVAGILAGKGLQDR
ncbi:YdeI family protein [Thalassospira sp. MCCC 1A03138]|uniref:YdeI/OmpD-associated family protein n=1 Tax=Thalassospira sp. MCCC 1A03138 TaxID=1470576 RepID=UPI000A1FE8AD|nr:DUF1801 domain-containing protein [Thalassospira sp. MCCC 1A03138]OSQ28221.1 hypothetical protein TH468_18910 [Thalassospira sp. MCCC 1A03138]